MTTNVQTLVWTVYKKTRGFLALAATITHVKRQGRASTQRTLFDPPPNKPPPYCQSNSRQPTDASIADDTKRLSDRLFFGRERREQNVLALFHSNDCLFINEKPYPVNLYNMGLIDLEQNQAESITTGQLRDCKYDRAIEGVHNI